ncbi:MAG TPA: tetratricopeptide repeat protein [Methylophilaceae bacterium]|nr:tetratricopeptide repeat protein [Methylophilaceae bacterium]
MTIKLENTLKITFITLIIISFNVFSKEPSKEVLACNQAVNKGDAETALRYAKAILEKNSSDHEGLLCKGRSLKIQGKYEDALVAMQSAVEAAKEPFAKTISYILIGNLHQSNNKSEEAIASYTKSLEICTQTGNQTYSRINHNLIGDTHKKQNDLNAALDSYATGLRLANNDNERAESFENVAKIYNAQGNHDKAIEFQLKAVVMQKQAGSLTAYADSSLLLGQYFYDAKSYSEAERHYKKLAKFAKDNGGAYYEASANYHLAEAMYANGDKTGARTLIVDAKQLAEKIGAKQLAEEIAAAEQKLKI